MRIVHVNDIAFVASTLVSGLEEAGVEARLIEPAKPGASWAYPWKLLTLPVRAWPMTSTALRLRFGNADVVHIHYATQMLPGVLSGRPLIGHCHGSDVRGVAPGSGSGQLLAALLARASAVLYSTPDLAEWVEPLRADARFLPNPIDTRAFSPDPSGTTDVLVGTKLDPIKGLDEIIEVIGRVRALRPGTSFTIIANGHGIERAISAAGPLTTMIPVVGHHEMPELLSRHRIAIGQFRLGILSQFELEAMASGVPVATAFRYGGRYQEPPPLMPAARPDQAAASMIALLDDQDMRQVLATDGRAWVVRHHRLDAIVRRLLGIYQEVLAR